MDAKSSKASDALNEISRSGPLVPKKASWFETLRRLVSELRNQKSDAIRVRAAKELSKFVATQARESKPDVFGSLMADVTKYISDLVSSTLPHENVGGLVAIIELAEVDFRSHTTALTRLAEFVRSGLNSPDATVLSFASRALGRLARVPITLVYEMCAVELKRALETLTAKDRVEMRRLGAFLVLKSLAADAPTMFYSQLPSFVELVWVGLRDSKPQIRETAAEALGLALRLIGERDNALQWNRVIYSEANLGFKTNSAEPSVHGSLLCLGQLLSNAGEFMSSRVEEASKVLLSYKNHKDRSVKQMVITLLPRVAASNSEEFVRQFMPVTMEYLLKLLSEGPDSERSVALISVGEMAVATKRDFLPFLDAVIKEVQLTLSLKDRKSSVNEALCAVALLAEGVGPALHRGVGMREFLEQIFSVELSPTLIKALEALVTHLPSLLKEIQLRLMNVLSNVLAQRPFESSSGTGAVSGSGSGSSSASSVPGSTPVTSTPLSARKDGSQEDKKAKPKKSTLMLNLVGKKNKDKKDDQTTPRGPNSPVPGSPTATEEEKAPEQIALALKTLGSFNLTRYITNIDEFLREIAVNFLEEENGAVRREAAVAVSQLLVRILVSPTRATSPILLAEVIERLLVLGISDPDPTIRRTVLENLDPRLDNYLADAENLRSLFIALNDEEFAIRELAIGIIGRLALRSPAYVMPSLRRTLIQQLTELEFSGDSKIKEESAKLLGASIRSAKHLMEPYVKPILKALLPKLDPSQDPRVRQEVLATLGELSGCAQTEIVPHLDLLMPIILSFLEDSSSSSRRETALQVLGQLAQHVTSEDIDLLSRFPALISALLDIVKVEKSRPLRQLCLRVLGLLGAADPYTYKMILMQNSPEKSTAEEDDTVSLGPLSSLDATSENFYPFAAVSALVDILADRSLGAYHAKCIMALILIAKECLGDQQRIQHVLLLMMPPFLDVLRSSPDHSMQVFMFERLAMLVSIVARSSERVSALRPYLEQLLGIIEDAWQSPQLLPHVLTLVEDFSFTFGDEFKVYLPVLIPKLLSVLHPDNAELCPRILRNLEVIGANLDDYLHLITPAVMKLVSQMDNDSNDVRKLAIQTIGRLCRILNFAEFASRIIHPLARILQQQPLLPGDELIDTIMNTMCHLIYQVGSDYATFIPMMNRILLRQGISHGPYDLIITKLLKGQPILENDLPPVGDLARDRRPTNASPSAPSISSQPNSSNNANSVGVVNPQTAGVPPSAASNSANAPTGLGMDQESKQINEQNLKKVWGASQQSTKEDWAEWMRTFSVALVRESPEPAIRFCFELAQEYYPLVRSLFNAAFLSCWNALNKPARAEFIDNLRIALKSPHMPPEILQMWLNAAEFLEHARLPLPIELKELGRLANKCRAYAKALHYKELEFQTTRSGDIIESLIFLNNELQQPEAAEGILSYAQQSLSVDLKESWYEKLHRWEDALQVYQKKPITDPQARFGTMRSLHALGEWEKLLQLSEDMWRAADSDQVREQIAPWAAAAASNLHKFDALQSYLVHLKDSNVDTALMKTLAALQKASDSAEALQEVRDMIARTRDLIDTELTALVAESYQRAYDALVAVQILSEMEEVIDVRLYSRRSEALLTRVWPARLSRCERSVKTWQRVLAVRSVIDVGKDSWLKFAALCRKKGALRQSHKVLVRLLGIDPSRQPMAPLPTQSPDITYQYILQLWAAGAKDVAYQHLVKFERSLRSDDNVLRAKCSLRLGSWLLSMTNDATSESVVTLDVPADQVVETVLSNLQRAVELHPRWYRAWHMWATCNFDFASEAEKRLRHTREESSTDPGAHAQIPRTPVPFRFVRLFGHQNSSSRIRLGSLGEAPHTLTADTSEDSVMRHVEASVRGFFRSISLSARSETLQDTLRVLTLWFKHGAEKRIEAALLEGFGTLSVETWIQVIPQLIARMDTPNSVVRKLVLDLLSRIGKEHPQALVYPLTLAAKSQVTSRQMVAQSLMGQMRSVGVKSDDRISTDSAALLDQAIDVSKELIRVSITLFEAWHEALEEASQLYFTQSNPDRMLEVLRPLHLALHNPAETILDSAFQSTYSGMLNEAWHWCEQFLASGRHKICLNQAWDLYYHTFKSISRQLEKMSTLELRTASPRLLEAKLLDLAVPGTYEVGKPVVRIASFHPTLQVISSKQRPRKLRMKGSNGLDYAFLLKGHEDLRQDERVMQLFGLINNLLAKSHHTASSHLRIKRMSVIPLAPNSGLIGWVPHCDTLHQLIKEYRSTCEPKIPFNLEFKLLNHMSGDYNSLLVAQKIEVFKYTLGKTDGKDLAKIMWLKSPSSEVWLDRRTNFTRSLAVMSQAGYILGLGDRHPSNIMVDRATGHVVHIDFGDCFEVANLRDKFPEKVPFRLTRMLINAMEVSGIEGTFRTTCEKVMSVLRENRDSVMAVLEAFVYDPLINWRLLAQQDQPQPSTSSARVEEKQDPTVVATPTNVQDASAAAGKELTSREGRTGDEQELNERAVAVINRVHKKLTGRDFEIEQSNEEVVIPVGAFTSEGEQRVMFERVKPKGQGTIITKPLTVQEQVNKLIQQATSHENLCQAYQGWCPFW